MPRVLATQSHVVHGYVGNKAATFPLQCLGWDVDCCNSVQFSNHTGYGMDKVFGSVTSEKELNDILSGLFSTFQYDYDAFLSGYLPNKESVRCVGLNYRNFKKSNPDAIWLMDPVMGDEGQLYVDEDVIPEYKRIALESDGLVDIITPNQFEFEILHGEKISTVEELKSALTKLHRTIPMVVLTSCMPNLFNDSNNVYCVASLRDHEPLVFRVPLIESYFTGVGDLFSALLLDRLYKFNASSKSSSSGKNISSFKTQINEVLNVVHNVLLLTKKYAPKDLKSVIGVASKMKDMELRIIESRDFYSLSFDKDQLQNSKQADIGLYDFFYKSL
ncbi:hypothetical protein Kpol_480p2 [Vanderwaltozyma polyspora DSM 70294]|uniref:pyridoxal kinase n=1 Tax=Vanderwaltozyma polyspora (strain ATCC 22028 / DSM 70294 / BCRC 21397 / CBS 2163 / NBRC 10782 / NRRL Y-8283 / UCD 57-17) TaxID=436907 RepID=A7TP64_VANPO|nr:uncharacterized protein Kpol_480p2 [Vanderwaltozyma polyspora DSM 70294]EDO15915.1 hypothetical protein Kpol_480p2 [Vanderwaltozyma polyspora DSM 70294]